MRTKELIQGLDIQNDSSDTEECNVDDEEDEDWSNSARHFDSNVICMNRKGIISPSLTRTFSKYWVKKFLNTLSS